MRVLIIDDDPGARMGMRRQILGEWPEAEVLEAPTLARGLALTQGRKPDLVVLDLLLPDAFGLASAHRTLISLRGVPLLVLSSQADLTEGSRMLEMGAVAYLPRSLRASELLPALHRIRAGGRFITASLAYRILGIPASINRR